MPDLIEAIETVETMDFDILVPGHGPIGTKADAADHRRYVQELYDGVLAGLRADPSVEEMQAGPTMDAYGGWLNAKAGGRSISRAWPGSSA